MQPRACEGGVGKWGRYLETCLCVCVCLDINNVVHVPATFIATSHGGRHARWQSAPKLSATLLPPSPFPASTTAPGVQHSSVLAVFASIAANDILLAKVQNLPVHSCRSRVEPRVSEKVNAYCPLPHCPQSSLACHKNNARLPLSKQAGVAASGFACFGHLQLLPP